MSQFTAFLEAAAEVQLLLDADGRIVHVGGCPEYVMGYSRSTLEQQSVLAAVTPEQRGGFASAFQQVRSGVAQPLFAMSWPTPWPGQFDVGVQLSALIEDARLLGVTMKGYELSSRYAFESFLRNDAPTSVAHARKSPMAMFFLDAGGQCTFMNDRWVELTGQTTADALGFGFLATVHPADRERFKQIAGQGHQRKEGWRLLFNLILPNGSTRSVDAAAAPLIGPDGTLIAYLCAFTPYSAALAAPGQSAATQSTPTPSAPTPPTQSAPPAQPDVQPAGEPEVHAEVQPEASPEITPEPDLPLSGPSGSVPERTTAAAPAPAVVAAHLPFVMPSDFTSPTMTRKSNSWDPPLVKDGYTEPHLLLGQKKLPSEIEAETPPSEPGLDKVTGLANRLLFAQHVASTVSRMQSDALTVSVSFVHLHGLEATREAIGGRATNDYLFLLAKRLEATIRSIEIAGRIEGDIVGVLSINWLFADDLPVVAQRLLMKLGEPLAGKDGQPMNVAMSLGMAVAHPGEHVNDLFTRAWNALQLGRQNQETHFEIDYGT